MSQPGDTESLVSPVTILLEPLNPFRDRTLKSAVVSEF